MRVSIGNEVIQRVVQIEKLIEEGNREEAYKRLDEVMSAVGLLAKENGFFEELANR